MTSRERVLAALNFQETDRVPCDLDAMGSTGISAFAYPKLVKALGLPPRRTRIYDTWQMIAVVDRDVLDALECDCICVNGENCANVLPEPEKWRPYDFNGRLEALVLDPSSFRVLPDGTIEQRATPFCGVTHMPPNGYVFSEEHGGQAVDLSGEFVLEDLDRLRDQLLAEDVTPEQARRTSARISASRRPRRLWRRRLLRRGLRLRRTLGRQPRGQFLRQPQRRILRRQPGWVLWRQPGWVLWRRQLRRRLRREPGRLRRRILPGRFRRQPRRRRLPGRRPEINTQ